ncbi:MAG: hypothetical protein P8P89_08985, partial [Paracoccaceae bacterium]|nr:hypothetical protein [Paracoccaceae bacterium]
WSGPGIKLKTAATLSSALHTSLSLLTCLLVVNRSGAMGLCLYVGNRNYSSWSMRPGVLLRAFDIPFEEKLIRFDSFAPDSQFKKIALTLTPNADRQCADLY